MALIVEDGSGILNANSFASLDYIKAYMLARGIALPVDVRIEQFSTFAIDYMNTLEFVGERVLIDLPFPRTNIILASGQSLPSDTIPTNIVRAQAQLIADQARGVELLPTSNPQAQMKRSKVGPIEREYFAISEVGPNIPVAQAMLDPLLRGHGSFSIRTVRV